MLLIEVMGHPKIYVIQNSIVRDFRQISAPGDFLMNRIFGV